MHTPTVLLLHTALPHQRPLQLEPTVNKLKKRGLNVIERHINTIIPYVDGYKLMAVEETGRALPDFDACYYIGNSTPAVLDRLRALKEHGKPMVNDPDAIALAMDKHDCSVALMRAGVPVPAHLLLSANKKSKEAVVRLFGPCSILKPRRGSLGTNVMFIPNPGVLDRVRVDGSTLGQQYLPDAARGDLRIFVVGGKVVASMLRVPARGEHRANLARGGKGFYHEATPEEARVALAAAEALGLVVAGVDIVPTDKGPVVIEVNSKPGHKIAEITEVKTRDAIADEVARLAKQQARRRNV